MKPGDSKDETGVKRLIRICLNLGVRVNKAFLLLTKCLQILLLPQLSAYQYRAYLVYLLQVLGSESFQLLLAKSLQSYYYVENLLLLLSVGSCLPFLRVVYNLWRFIPCPPMASLISNVALILTLIFLFVLGIGRFQDSLFQVYTYSMMIWPWLVLTSVVSRLFIERQAGRNPFSPVKDLPILGFFGAVAAVLAFLALKQLTICDCLVLTVFDNVLAAAVASVLMGKHRRKRHFRAIKVYTIMCVFMGLYFFGDQGLSNMSMTFPLNESHILWIASRFFLVTRSIYVKWKYATFHHTKEPSHPPENLLLFYANSRPMLHRFRGFPSPMLSVLDCVFDSGLRDTELHGMGPLGTEDLYNLTEYTYLLPVASLASWLMEVNTLSQGLLPRTGSGGSTALNLALDAAAASAAEGAATVQVTGGAQPVLESAGSLDLLVAITLVVVFCISKLLTPVAMSRTLFDRASPIHVWKYQPLMVAAPAFFYDVLSLNSYISKYQICILLLLAAMNAVYRADMWNAFKRKYLLLQTQDLHYQAPSTVRQLQRKTLLQFLERTSTDDYGNMLLETSIGHGTNIRELARDMSVSVWDPSPSSTAAWKLAFSLVTKSLRRQKLLRKQKMDTKQEVHRFIERIVHEMVDTAVDTAAGHGARMKLAGSLAQVTAKRRAMRRLRQHALNRRTLRAQRRAGQLSATAAHLSTASGTLRSVQDLKRDMGPMRPLLGPGSQKPKALPAPNGPNGSMPRITNGTTQSMQKDMTMSQTSQSWASPIAESAMTGLSLSPSQTQDLESGGFSPTSAVPTIPGEVMTSQMSMQMSMTSTEFGQLTSGVPVAERGVWYSGYSMGGPPAGGSSLLIVCFGDAKRGQLGVEPTAGARQISRQTTLVVEELRHQEPVQIEAGGVASFVVGSKGQVWAFGSNRSMELGGRKEVAQIASAQRMKSVRDVHVVQVSSANSTSGQSHTLVLGSNGEVHSFGASNCGALGQGPDVRQSAPLLLRFSAQVPVKMIATGARHSLLLTDTGRLFAMGDNTHGQLGMESRLHGSFVDTPRAVEGALGDEEVQVKLLAAGDSFTMAVTEDDLLYTWGANANGQLGLGRLTDQMVPQPVPQLSGSRIGAICCGACHSIAITNDGAKVWAWGSNVHGQLGVGVDGANAQRVKPSLIPALSNRRDMVMCQVTAASNHSLALTTTGEVFAFGLNSHGQLGFPTVKSANEVFAASTDNGGDPVTQHQMLQQKALQDRAKARNKVEMDQPKLYESGIEKLWLPVRVVSLSQYRVRAMATGEMHTLTIAQHYHG